jgi:myo-inositol-1-phosphate synthase
MSRVAIVGLGNCASALVQGVHYYTDESVEEGLVRSSIGGITVGDISFVVGFDVDVRKIGWPIQKAIFKGPNCCMPLSPGVEHDTSDRFSGTVYAAPVLDGVSDHMKTDVEKDKERFMIDPRGSPIADVIHFADRLHEFNVDVLINYLPVGSQKATEFWAEVCLLARVPMVNCIPVFIASNPDWNTKFIEAGVAVIGDDMKSQFGASVVSQMLQELAETRGHKVKVHIQQNSGGNTDFLNMTNQDRLASKKISKENVLRSHGIEPDYYHAGPADYIRVYGDTKVAHFRLELEGFCKSPVIFDARLQVQDSPNSAGVVIDALRYAIVAQRKGIYGSLHGPSAFTQKSPPEQMTLQESVRACDFLANVDM